MNAQSVASALAQMPATAYRAAALSGGVHSVPNAVYAEMVGTAGVHAGEDELTLYSGLPENRGKKIVVIDADGKVLLIANGTRQGLEYEVSDRRAALGRFVEEADIALYKTPDHWRRLARPGVSGCGGRRSSAVVGGGAARGPEVRAMEPDRARAALSDSGGADGAACTRRGAFPAPARGHDHAHSLNDRIPVAPAPSPAGA